MTPPVPASLLRSPAADPALWPLDPAIVFLNHGSFGSCPRPVLEFQQELRARLERQPIRFFVRELEELWDAARHALARFVRADPEGLIFLPNATTGVNTVLRSLRFQPDDELLVTNHEYNACRNALDFAAERAGARVVPVSVPFPLPGIDAVVEAILHRVTARTRLVLLDHVTSQTGLIFPVQRLVRELAARGIDTLVDGAHAPGMLPLDISALGAAYYTGNCHKWLCAPKGAAFLAVRHDRRDAIRPLVISHGANSPRTDRSRFLIEFGWTGTGDPTAWLSLPEALRFMHGLLPGGWPAVMQRNRALALAARRILCAALHLDPPSPDECIGALASVPLPDATEITPSKSPLYLDPLQDELMDTHAIEVPVIPWPAPPQRLIRVSAQLYNALPQYELLAGALARRFSRLLTVLAVLLLGAGCQSFPLPGTLSPRAGDEIVVAGQFVHTSTPVVLWMDPGGYDAYRVERRFSPYDESAWETSKVAVKALTTPNRYGLRRNGLTETEVDRVRGGGWDLPLLQDKVDQFVIHFDVSGTSRRCFTTLHDLRGLSVHFMLDLDGIIYQTLDLKERAWHATTSNSRSIGIEIANIGAYPATNLAPLTEWYQKDETGRVRVVLPERPGESGVRTPGFVPRPSRPAPITGLIQGKELAQYDFTPQQYEALIRLTAALCRVFPKLRCDYPRDPQGRLIPGKLPDDELRRYQGLLGHYHVQADKVDPGPAFDWDRVVQGAREWMRPKPALSERPASGLMDRSLFFPSPSVGR